VTSVRQTWMGAGTVTKLLRPCLLQAATLEGGRLGRRARAQEVYTEVSGTRKADRGAFEIKMMARFVR
jgi:hypothetical protein